MKDEEILRRAKADFQRCEDWEGAARNHWKEDTKFRHGDSYNKWQWPATVSSYRETNDKPMLTVNKTNVHCLQVINDARQNKQGIKVTAVGEDADGDAADILEGVIRHIEYRSNAQQAYDAATDHMVTGGIGYVRVDVDYVDEDAVDEQDIFIRRVPNPLNVYLDPDIQEYDGSDARFGFVFEDVPRREAEQKYPRFKDAFADAPLSDEDAWDTKEHVRVCEYWVKGEKADTVAKLQNGTTIRKSELPDGAWDQIEPFILKQRPTTRPEVMWYLLIGDKIVDRREWLGRYIPIARAVGTETVIDGVLDRKGHVRALLDPQRMYNYNTSGSVEWVAGQARAPWLTPAAAIEGVETHWSTSNITKAAVLPFNHVDDAGNPIPPPQKIEPPTAASGHIEGMKVAQEEMMLVSGQYQAVMGAPSNETSGKAINARQRQGDNSTYHFIDHISSCIRFVGRIVLDLIPRVYDVPRVLCAIGADGNQMKVHLDPGAGQAVQKVQPYDDDEAEIDPQKVAAVLNPTVGKYDVISDVGPSYATQRQEAFNAFSQIMAQNKEAFTLVGDLWAQSADFPGADKLADRLHNMIPPQAKGGPSPEVVQMHQQMQQLAQQGQQQIEQLHAELQAAKTKLDDQTRDQERKDYEAETNRLRAVGSVDPEALRPVLREVISQAIGQHIGPLMDAHAAADQARVPQPEPVEAMNGTN